MSMELLRCLLLPIQDRILILPYSCVAEVVPLANPETFSGSQEWQLGHFLWRGLEIPLVSIDMLEPGKKFVPRPAQLVAVLNRFSDAAGTPDFIGIVLSSVPRMGRYKSLDFKYVSDGDLPYIEMNVTARNAQVSIPNMAWITEQIK